MQLRVGQRVRVMWLRDVIASESAEAVGMSHETTVSGMLIPAGTIYDGVVAKVALHEAFELLLTHGAVISLHSDDPVLAIAVLTEFAPRHE